MIINKTIQEKELNHMLQTSICLLHYNWWTKTRNH